MQTTPLLIRMDKYYNGFKANPGSVRFLLGPFVDRLIKIMGSTIKSSKGLGIIRSED